jgi:hypothetical protein
LNFCFNICKHFFTNKHFIKNKASTPDITPLVVIFKVDNFRGSIQWSAGAFGHHNVDISGKTKISDFEFLMLIKENIVRFQVSVNLV